MPPRRGAGGREERWESGREGRQGEEMRDGGLRRRRRRCACVRPRVMATAVAVAVAGLGVDASALTGNATCGVAAESGVWTTRTCAQVCGRQDAVCAFRSGQTCGVQDASDAHFCVSYAGEDGGECLVECQAVGEPASDWGAGWAGNEWVVRVAQGETAAVIGQIEPPRDVAALTFVGGDRWKGDEAAPEAAATRVEFVAGLDDADYLTSMAFIGLDLTSTGLPFLPSTLTHLEIEGCVLATFPVDTTTRLPALESLVLYNNYRSQEESESMPTISEEELLFLASRLNGVERLALGEQVGSKCSGGQVATIGEFSLCVDSNNSRPTSDHSITAIARRLVDSSTSKRNDKGSESSSSSSSGSGSSSSSSIWPTSKYVLVSLAAPFLYFIYKVGLFFYFLKTYSKHEREYDSGVMTSMDTVVMTPHTDKLGQLDSDHDVETQRPTLEGSSGSLSRSPEPMDLAVADTNNTPRAGAARPQQPQQQLASANFWVDEELQSWRVDFRLFSLKRCLTLSASQKRQTLRKASVTTAAHPREIWLAAYKSDGSDATSADRHQLVALKFVPPTTSTGTGGANDASSSQDKLRAELRRQAQFSHPNVASFIGVAWSPQTHLVAVTEYLEQGDLRQWLHLTSRPTKAADGQVFGPGLWPVAKLQMLVDLARALVYLHSMHPPVAHGNCNSRNVLLTAELRAKFSDFGNAAGEVLSERDRLAYSAVGSGRWISPEALLGREPAATPKGSRDAGDVYSFGVLIAEIDSHALPFSDLMRANRSALPETDILQLIAQGALSPTLSDTCAPEIVKLVAACTRYSPAQRPSSKQVLATLQRALQESKDAAAREKAAARLAPPAAGEADQAPSAVDSGEGGSEQYYYYAGDESKAAPSFV